MPRLRLMTIAACSVAAAVPSTADAVVSCDFDAAQKRLDVTLSASGNHASIQRDGANIRVAGSVCPDGDKLAAVTNVDKVVVKDTSNGDTSVAIMTGTGAFAPGATAEGDGKSEIEFEIDGGSSLEDSLSLVGGSANDAWVLGKTATGSGVNLNPADENQDDVDVETKLVNTITAAPGDGDDSVSGAGAAPFDGPLAIPMTIFGGDNDDTLVGGSGSDLIEGWTGTNSLRGGLGDDTLRGHTGQDVLDGDDGIDAAEYDNATAGVTVDLRKAAYQETGGAGLDRLAEVEDVIGSKHADVLTGTDGPNKLYGRGAADVLTGLAGNDGLAGEAGTDRVVYTGAPAGVTVDLEIGGQQNTQGAGSDKITGVENILGSAHADTLKGNGGPNVLEGAGGTDQLFGFGDADTLLVRDGVGDTADCGAGADSAQTDMPGMDALAACENVDALPAPQPEPEPKPDPKPDPKPEPQPDPKPQPDPVAPAPNGPATPGETAPVTPTGPGTDQSTQPAGIAEARDLTAPAVAGLRRRGRKILFRVTEAGTVKVTVTRGRTKRTLTLRGVAGPNRIKLPRRLRSGRIRVSVRVTDAAGNRSRAATKRFRIRR